VQNAQFDRYDNERSFPSAVCSRGSRNKLPCDCYSIYMLYCWVHASVVLFVYLFQEQLLKQLDPYGYGGKFFYAFIALSLVPDCLGFLPTMLLAHKVHYDVWAYVSNLSPSALSIDNTMINAYS
jgi:hypothetical protein